LFPFLHFVFRRRGKEVDDASEHVGLRQVEERVQDVDPAVVQQQEPVGILLANFLPEKRNSNLLICSSLNSTCVYDLWFVSELKGFFEANILRVFCTDEICLELNFVLLFLLNTFFCQTQININNEKPECVL
jgi:hypothetical protein